jgi:hypothetical protein
MSLSERRSQRLADRRIGPLDQEAAADLETLTDWSGALVIPMMNLRGETYFGDDPSLVDPYEQGVDIYFTKMALHSLDRVAALKPAADTADDEPFDEHTAIALVPDHGLSRGELVARFVAAAEAAAIPSCVPDADMGLTDAVAWSWVVVDDLIDRITTYLRPLTEFEWQDFAQLCARVLELAPTAAASSGIEQRAQLTPGTGDTPASQTPDPSC